MFAMTSLIVIALSSYVVWYQMGQIALGLHGWIALIAGSVGMVVLGGGLMALSFYSARSGHDEACLLYTSPSPRDRTRSRMPSSA